jgi:hypothetical protein
MKLAATPVSGTVLRLFAGGRQNPGPQLRGQHRGRLSGVAGTQSVQTCARRRCFQRMMVGAVVPSLCLIDGHVCLDVRKTSNVYSATGHLWGARLAMGDRAGNFAFVYSGGINQLEGLMNDRAYLEGLQQKRVM